MDLIVVTAGHIDHGKTELIKALTGTDTDRLPQEKSRGITIDLGFAELAFNGCRIGFIDVPGHEKFVRNMLAGAGGIDSVLLIVAADEGVMPQTREHFEICRLLEINSGIIAITKCDLVDDRELVDLVRAEIAELTEATPLAAVPVIECSSRTHAGIDEIRSALIEISRNFRRGGELLAARLPIDRSFTVKGFGTVVTGTLVSGNIEDQMELELLPERRRVRIRGIETFGQKAQRAVAGQRVALNIAGKAHNEIKRGMLLAEPAIFGVSQSADALIRILATAPRPLTDRQRLRIHTGTAELMARVRILDESGEIRPGESGFIQLRFESPSTFIFGQRFIARTYSPQHTIGGGEIILPSAKRTKRREFPDCRRFLQEMLVAKRDPAKLIRTIIGQSGTSGVSDARLLEILGWRTDALHKTISEATIAGEIIIEAGQYYSPASAAAGERKILELLDRLHQSNPLKGNFATMEILSRAAVSGFSEPLISFAFRRLAEKGKIELRGDAASLAGRDTKLSVTQAAIAEKLKNLLFEAGLQPPKISELIDVAGSRDLSAIRSVLRYLAESGEIVIVSEEFAFDRGRLLALLEKIFEYADRSEDRTIDVAAFKEISGLSRKFAIPILEYLDRQGITRRNGDRRVVRKRQNRNPTDKN